MKHTLRYARLGLLMGLFLLCVPSFAQQIPKTEFTTLSGTHAVIPDESSNKPMLLVVCFSHKGSDDVAAWNKHYHTAYETDPRVEYYELADFQGVPSLVMKMILHGMRRSVHEPEKSHTAPFYSNEESWKELVGYSDPNIGYLLLTDRSGHVVWQMKGPATDAKTAEAEAAIQKLQPQQK